MTTPSADGAPDRPAPAITAAQRLALALGTSSVAEADTPDEPVTEGP